MIPSRTIPDEGEVVVSVGRVSPTARHDLPVGLEQDQRSEPVITAPAIREGSESVSTLPPSGCYSSWLR